MADLRIDRLALLLNGLAFLGFGLIFAGWPDQMLGLLDLRIDTGAARTDLRAIYGGLESGFGLWLLLAARSDDLRRPALISVALATLGLVCGRGLGLLMDGADRANLLLGSSELCALLLSLAGLRAGSRDSQ